MNGATQKCGTQQCPLNTVLDDLLKQAELQTRVNRMLWDNVRRLADMVTMRGCPSEACTIAAKGKR
jgi:hypothetical protein